MKDLKKRIVDVSQYLQRLMEPDIFPEIQRAVETKDKHLLDESCRKIKIPEIYISAIIVILFSVSPQQKWPFFF